MRIRCFFRALRRDAGGTSAVEYGIILGLIVFGLVVAIGGVASETLKMWSHINSQSAKAQNGN